MIFPVAAAGLCSLTATAAGEKPSAVRPNILCIVCEDISPYLGCYGDRVAKSPNLDRLATQSVRYTEMHTTIGVSSPSRFGLITGMYPSAMGANYMRTIGNTPDHMPPGIEPYEAVLPEGVKCYTEYLRAAGYYCTNNSKTDYQFLSPLTAWDECSNKAHWKNRPEGAPFLAIFNLFVTHESQLWERASLPLEIDPADVVVPPYLVDNPVTRRDLAVMYSNIAEMDRQSAALIREMEEAGLADNTVVVWYSDNGGPIQRGKRELYQTGANVPFMIRWPDGRGAGSVERRLCMFPDVPATILSVCGIRPPSYMHGRAFAGKYEAAPRRYTYGARDRLDEVVDKKGAVYDGRYRYLRNYMPQRADYLDCEYQNHIPSLQLMRQMFLEGTLTPDQAKWFAAPRPEEEFYDLQNDPYELHNLIGERAYAGQIERLRAEYGRWIKKYNARWMLSEEQSRALFYPGGRQPAMADPVAKVSGGRVALVCPTRGASLAYRVKGEAEWSLYTAPFAAQAAAGYEAIAVRAGYKNSNTITIDIP